MLTAPAPPRRSTAPPLYVDLDGTLVATDLLWETLLVAVKRRPLTLIFMVFWLVRGRAYVKARLAAIATPDPALLPYRPEVVAYIEAHVGSGAEAHLATAANQRVAEAVASHIGLFSEVLASDGRANLKGSNKLHAIRSRVGGREFGYMGDSSSDLEIWREAARVIVVAPPKSVLRRARRSHPNAEVLGARRGGWWDLFVALRPYQWAKNVLLFVPLVLAHRLADVEALAQILAAFVAFSLCASAVYVVNDLLDLGADRAHPRKRHRAFASGAVPIPRGLLLVPSLLVGAGAITVALLPAGFALALGIYVVATTAYSFVLKRIAVVDVVTLAGVYTLRVVAGALAIEVPISPWLPAFSMFIFMSLALVKRYSELRLLSESSPGGRLSGREYSAEDTSLLASIGPASGYLAVLVLALYINSREVVAMYRRPEALWLIGPLLLYWITRVWLLAHRGRLHDDPLLFTLRDRPSYLVAGLLALILLVASL